MLNNHVVSFFNESNKILEDKNIFNENELLKTIYFHYNGISYISTLDFGYSEKLIILSKILKENNLKEYTIEQSFNPTTLGDIKEFFSCSIFVEPINDVEKIQSKKLHDFAQKILKRREENELNQKSLLSLNRPRFFNLLNQKKEIINLYKKINEKFNAETSVILTAIFLFEMEMASISDSLGLCYYQQFFNQVNKNDIWIAGLTVKSTFYKPVVILK